MRRFYKEAAVSAEAEGFAVTLDGKTVRTPEGTKLVLPNQALAEAVASEWLAQVETIKPHTMPLTQLASTALDRMGPKRGPVVDHILSYADTDLLCYRAMSPGDLVERHLFATCDRVLGIAFCLGNDCLGFGMGMLDHRRRVLFGVGDLCGIFRAQGFSFCTQSLGFVELLADSRNLLVQTAGNGGRNLFPHENQQKDQHRRGNDGACTDTGNRRLGCFVAFAVRLFDHGGRCLRVSHGRELP